MKQSSLFTENAETENSAHQSQFLLDGLQYQEDLLSDADATSLLNTLIHELDWQQPYITIAGKRLPIPRLQHWQGDGELRYRYSGETFVSRPWHPKILALKNVVELVTKAQFNSVLCNLYRNKNDSVAWHADDEPELGPSPLIASISLGASREFQIKHKSASSKKMKIQLAHNSLLVMPAGFQAQWLHQLPKCKAGCSSRINLTFRYIY
jgi:alkylated DNA repair dioxygenase AlkB